MDQAQPKLCEVGQVYVTLAAARQYAESARHVYAEGETLQIEEARRELTELLLDAHRVQGDTETPERWRFRRQSVGVDLNVRIAREGRLLVVVGLTARVQPPRSARR